MDCNLGLDGVVEGEVNEIGLVGGGRCGGEVWLKE